MGIDVGDRVGFDVGGVLGDGVVGIDVGVVGLKVGVDVGVVGLVVGMLVGFVGLEVGINVGVGVGMEVGVDVGALVGMEVGGGTGVIDSEPTLLVPCVFDVMVPEQ